VCRSRYVNENTGIGRRSACSIAVKRRILHAVLPQRRTQLSSSPSDGGLLQMDSLICLYQMLMESAVSMWHSWHHLALQESSLSSSPSFMPCHACLSPPSLLFCLSFPLEPWSAWKMRVTLPRPLLWPAFYPISQSLGVVQQALSFLTFMRFKYVYLLTCHSTYNFFFASFP
jgi:hypothetical protein